MKQEGPYLKRDRKRQIRDYSKFRDTDKEYYGLFYRKGKLRIDVKRLAKQDLIPLKIVKKINSVPRNTAYFFPKKKKKSEYICNITRMDIDSLIRIWKHEIHPVINRIKTPSEAGHDAYIRHIHTGILDSDELQIVSVMESIKRERDYYPVIKSIYGQYIHFIGSAVEHLVIKIMKNDGHILKRTGMKNIKDLLYKEYNVKFKKLQFVDNYKKFYALWNFLKHNSLESYKRMKKLYPEILTEKPFENGNFALWYVNLDEGIIMEILNGLKEYFDSFCETVFKEDVIEASWNYDDYFLEKFQNRREDIENPLGLPGYL